jgi:hypothetical protein
MLASTVNLPTGCPPSPHIRAWYTSLDGTANGTADVDARVNTATHLGRQCCGEHENPGDDGHY